MPLKQYVLLQRFIKNIAQQFFYGNYFIALGAFCLALGPLFLKRISITQQALEFALFMFFSTHFAYHFHRFFGVTLVDEKLNTYRHNWYSDNEKQQKVSALFSLAGMIICSFFVGKEVFILLTPVFFLSALYNQKIGSFKGLRHVPGIKTILIAVVWGLSFSLPYYFFNFSKIEVTVLFIRNFTFIYAITLPFDIRDMERDPIWLKTLPQVVGINLTRIIILLLLLLTTLCGYFFSSNYWIVDSFVFLIVGIIIFNSKPNQTDKLYLIGLDSTIIIKVLLIGFISTWLK
ncbi:MAG: UbiA family prenyltransferase [Bacteroidia bacterium]|nr:UbiA family prenyltransferase [Bacteroidia bacterium]